MNLLSVGGTVRRGMLLGLIFLLGACAQSHPTSMEVLAGGCSGRESTAKPNQPSYKWLKGDQLRINVTLVESMFTAAIRSGARARSEGNILTVILEYYGKAADEEGVLPPACITRTPLQFTIDRVKPANYLVVLANEGEGYFRAFNTFWARDPEDED